MLSKTLLVNHFDHHLPPRLLDLPKLLLCDSELIFPRTRELTPVREIGQVMYLLTYLWSGKPRLDLEV